MKAVFPGVGAVAAAAGSALCCAGPVVAVSVGVSGAGLAAFEPYRGYFLALAAASLVFGFWLLDREEKAAGRASYWSKQMTRKEWAAVAIAIGGGILLQIPGHDDAMMDHAGMQHGEMPAEMAHAAEANARLQTVALDVTGMT